jgi:hypothetical protein
MARIGRSVPIRALFLRRLATLRAKVSTFTDDFSGGALDTVKWPTSGGPATLVGGQLQIPVLSSYNGKVQTALEYDFLDSAVYGKFTPPAVGNLTKEFRFRLLCPDQNNKIEFFWAQNNFMNLGYLNTAGGGSYSGGFSWPTSDLWWRISSVGQTIYWHTSTDGVTWTQRDTTTTTLNLTACAIYLEAGYYGTESASNFLIDNINVAPPAAQTVTATGIASGEALSTNTISLLYTLTATGIATGAALGTNTVTLLYTLTATGIATGAVSGTNTVTLLYTLTATGIATAEAVGTNTVSLLYTLTTTGIATGAVSGANTVSLLYTLTATGIATGAALGTNTVTTSYTITATGIATGETWRQTEPYTRWFGQGVPEGTLMTTSVVGAGDSAFSSIGGGSSQSVVSNTDIQFTYTVGNATVQWFFTPTNWRMARCDLIVPPTGMATSLQIARLMDTAGNALAGITLTGAGVGIGKVRIVNPDTTTHSESTWQLVQGTRYVVQILFGPNGATNYFRVNFYNHATGALFNTASTTTLPLGTGGQQVGRVYMGAWFYATSGQSITMGDFAHQDTTGTNLNDEIQWITTVSASSTITPTGIPTGEAFGTSSTGTPATTINPTGIATGAVLGTPTLFGGLHPHIVASTTVTTIANPSTIDVPVPAGMVIGDMMLVALTGQTTTSSTDFTATGFTRIGLPFVAADGGLRVLGWYARVFTATPPATVTFTAPTGSPNRMAGIALRVLNAGIPEAASAAAYGTGATTTPTSVTATVPHNGCLLLFAASLNMTTGNSDTVTTPPTGMTFVDYAIAGGGAASGTVIRVYKQQYETGTTDSKTLTYVGPSIANTATNLLVLEGGRVRPTGIASGEAFGTSICRFLPAVETFTDTFDSEVNATKWPTVENGGAVWEAGRAKLVNSLTGAYTSSLTDFSYDLRNSSCFVRVTPHTTAIAEAETVFSVYNAASDGGAFIVSGVPRTFHLRKREGVDISDVNLPFDPEAERWWKIQLVGNTMDFLTSPDGVFWTSIRTATFTTVDLSAVRVRMRVGNYGTTAGTQVAYFDNFNVVVPEDVAGIWNGTTYRTDAEIWNGLSWQPAPVVWNGTSWAML